jgi:hypothetical protein
MVEVTAQQGVMQVEAIIAMVPDPMGHHAPRAAHVRWFALPPHFTSWLTHPDWMVGPGLFCQGQGKSRGGCGHQALRMKVSHHLGR